MVRDWPNRIGHAGQLWPTNRIRSRWMNRIRCGVSFRWRMNSDLMSIEHRWNAPPSEIAETTFTTPSIQFEYTFRSYSKRSDDHHQCCRCCAFYLFCRPKRPTSTNFPSPHLLWQFSWCKHGAFYRRWVNAIRTSESRFTNLRFAFE